MKCIYQVVNSVSANLIINKEPAEPLMLKAEPQPVKWNMIIFRVSQPPNNLQKITFELVAVAKMTLQFYSDHN